MEKIKCGAKPFLFPQPAVLVGTMVAGKANFMLAAWCGVANHTPPMVTVAVRPSRLTEDGIRENGCFSLNVPPTELVAVSDYCGIVSGSKKDKAELFTVTLGEETGAPLVGECRVNLECKLTQTVELGTHNLHIGEIAEVHADSDCLVDGKLDMGRVDPLVYSMGDGNYWSVGDKIAKAFEVGKTVG